MALKILRSRFIGTKDMFLSDISNQEQAEAEIADGMATYFPGIHFYPVRLPSKDSQGNSRSGPVLQLITTAMYCVLMAAGIDEIREADYDNIRDNMS